MYRAGSMGVGQKRKTVKKWRKSAIFVLFLCGLCIVLLCVVLFLVFVHGIGGGDRFSEIVRSVSLVVICGYNTRRAKKTSFVAGGANTAVFYAHEPQRIAGKNLVASIQGSDYKKAHNVYYV